MNLLEQALNTHVHIGVSAGLGVTGVSSTQITQTTASEIENNSVKHGA
jgi:hypothetical protein